jgi:hypothetical protein
MLDEKACGNTFSGQHSYAPRRWPTGYKVACVCGHPCPPELLPTVEAALAATEVERERQRLLSIHPGDKRTGVEARGLMRQLI